MSWMDKHRFNLFKQMFSLFDKQAQEQVAWKIFKKEDKTKLKLEARGREKEEAKGLGKSSIRLV